MLTAISLHEDLRQDTNTPSRSQNSFMIQKMICWKHGVFDPLGRKKQWHM